MPVLKKYSKPIRSKTATVKKTMDYYHDPDYVYSSPSEDEEYIVSESEWVMNPEEEEEMPIRKNTKKRKMIHDEEEDEPLILLISKEHIRKKEKKEKKEEEPKVEVKVEVKAKKDEKEQSVEEETEISVEEEDFEEEADEFYNGVDDYQLLALEKEKPEIYAKFMEVRQHLISELPTIERILETPMELKDRAHIVELFEMFCVHTPLTHEWMELKEMIKDAMEKSKSKYKVQEKLQQQTKDKVAMEIAQLKNISSEEEETYEHTIALLNLPLKFKKLIYRKYLSLENAYEMNDETAKTMEWLSTVTKIPFGVYLQIPGEHVIARLKERLDYEFYGMEQVKENVLMYVSNILYNPETKSYPLGLIGPPGTAKTSIALAISQTLQFPFEQLSGGGLMHSDGIHGHSFTYIGSQCGDITKALIRMQCLNGILFIDEFDKLTTEKNLNSLLQLIDPVQNHQFKDNYVGEIPIDLSHIWFMLSMNALPENQALRDRIYCVQLQGYTEKDKFNILKNNIVPKQLKQHQLEEYTLEDAVLHYIVRHTDGEGMRQCIHMLTNLLSKMVFVKRHPDISTTFSKTKMKDPTITLDVVREWMKTTTESSYPSSMYM